MLNNYRPVRIAFVMLASLSLDLRARAELEVIEDAEGQQGLTVHRMTVTPAAEPVPALKHRFTIPLHKRRPGNAATHYLRSLGESNGPGIRWRRLDERYGEEIYDWYDYAFPTEKIPMEDFREVTSAFEDYVDNYIRDATSCRRCDWGLEEMDLRGMETIAYLLPDAQESRSASRGLAALSRLATMESRHDDALEYIGMNYQLGQDISKQRFLVCALIGMAEVGMANKSVIELIGSPNSPNMYWALSELPSPIIDMREAMNLEMSMGLRIFPVLLDVEERNHTPEEWSRLFTEAIQGLDENLELLGNSRLPKQKILAQLGATGISMVVYPSAKQRLIESGMSESEVEAMAVAQVLLSRHGSRVSENGRRLRKVDVRRLSRHAKCRSGPCRSHGWIGQDVSPTALACSECCADGANAYAVANRRLANARSPAHARGRGRKFPGIAGRS